MKRTKRQRKKQNHFFVIPPPSKLEIANDLIRELQKQFGSFIFYASWEENGETKRIKSIGGQYLRCLGMADHLRVAIAHRLVNSDGDDSAR